MLQPVVSLPPSKGIARFVLTNQRVLFQMINAVLCMLCFCNKKIYVQVSTRGGGRQGLLTLIVNLNIYLKEESRRQDVHDPRLLILLPRVFYLKRPIQLIKWLFQHILMMVSLAFSNQLEHYSNIYFIKRFQFQV